MKTSVEKDLTEIVEKMLNLNLVVEKSVIVLLKYACSHGKWKSLELLLKYLKSNSVPLLPIIAKHMGQKPAETLNFEKCFELLNNNPNIDVNLLDSTNKSALYYAIKSNHSFMIRELLRKGSYIGDKYDFNHFSIAHINPKLLEAHFDSCITTNGLTDSNCEIQFNFKNLVCNSNKNQANEMSIIEYISKSTNLKHLMMHPLISGFLSLKWNRLAPFFYINFLFCSIFSVITIAYVLVFYNYDVEMACTGRSLLEENLENDVSLNYYLYSPVNFLYPNSNFYNKIIWTTRLFPAEF